MNRIILSVGFILGTITVVSAQEIGVRFGDTYGTGVALDATIPFKNSRLHGDLAFNDGVGVDLLYDFQLVQLGNEALLVYPGLGAGVFLGDPFVLSIPAELGIEYRFNGLPLAMGLDWRPTLVLIETTDFVLDRFGFNVRFVFNN